MTLVDYLAQILGEFPAGYEPLQYIFAGLGFLFMLDAAFGILHAVVSWIGGR